MPIQELANFHRAFCERLEQLLPFVRQWREDIQKWVVCDDLSLVKQPEYLRATLPVVFLVIEPSYGSGTDTVLIVYKGDNTATALGLKDGEKTLWLLYLATLQHV